VKRTVAVWTEANDGAFPADAVPLARYGDECFYVTGHLNGPAASYPLWDFSAPTVDAFRAHAGAVEYPRTWGYPEIYGEAAYAWWMYTLHEGCANLCQVIRDEIAREAPGLRVFRNTTRMWAFDQINDHDGSGQDLLAQHLDVVHLDPYPVQKAAYLDVLVRDMSYCAGLARRHQKPLVPWLQAHVYGDLMKHPDPVDIDRMAEECWAQGVDAVVWLGYGGGNSFPAVKPESWARAGAFHARLAAGMPSKPTPRLAVLRGYRARAACSLVEADTIRNPADWLLQQWLEAWAVRHRRPYDVWEVAPDLDADARARLAADLAAYPTIVGTVPWPGAWVIGEGTTGTTVSRADAVRVQDAFEAEMRRRGLLPAKE
jgi:hypothetical protein